MTHNYAYLKDLDYFSELLKELAVESEYPLENAVAEINDYTAMVKMGIIVRLAADSPPLLIEMDQFKLRCCGCLVRGYQIRKEVLGLCSADNESVSPYLVLRLEVISMLLDQLEDLLLYYKEVAEAVPSNDFKFYELN